MNVLILEDEELTANRLASLLYAYDPHIQVLAQLPSVAKAIHWFTQAPLIWPDLIFLDIQLEDESGFMLIKRLNLSIPIIFTTAYEQYTLQAFKANSIDYLLKPIDPTELGAALDKFNRLHAMPKRATVDEHVLMQLTRRLTVPPYRDRFMVSAGPKLRSVPTQEVAYFFFEDKVTFLLANDGHALPIDYSLDRLGQLLNPNQFFRVNRSFLVAAWAIKSVYMYVGSKLKLELHPSPRQDVFVSIDRVSTFKEWFGR